MTLKEVAQQVADELTQLQLSDNAQAGQRRFIYAPHLVDLGMKLQKAIESDS